MGVEIQENRPRSWAIPHGTIFLFISSVYFCCVIDFALACIQVTWQAQLPMQGQDSCRLDVHASYFCATTTLMMAFTWRMLIVFVYFLFTVIPCRSLAIVHGLHESTRLDRGCCEQVGMCEQAASHKLQTDCACTLTQYCATYVNVFDAASSTSTCSVLHQVRRRVRCCIKYVDVFDAVSSTSTCSTLYQVRRHVRRCIKYVDVFPSQAQLRTRIRWSVRE